MPVTWSSICRVSKMWFCIFSVYLVFEIKELLNFQKPFPQSIISFNSSEKTFGEWSVPKKARTSVFLTNSCKVLEIWKKSSLHSIKLEEWFWRQVKRRRFNDFLSSIVSFNSISFAGGILLMLGYLPACHIYWQKLN